MEILKFDKRSLHRDGIFQIHSIFEESLRLLKNTEEYKKPNNLKNIYIPTLLTNQLFLDIVITVWVINCSVGQADGTWTGIIYKIGAVSIRFGRFVIRDNVENQTWFKSVKYSKLVVYFFNCFMGLLDRVY